MKVLHLPRCFFTGIVEMAELDPAIREKTDALDAAGNTTAAIGKGFAIGSAALVSLALFGAFVTRIRHSSGDGTLCQWCQHARALDLCLFDCRWYDSFCLCRLDHEVGR